MKNDETFTNQAVNTSATIIDAAFLTFSILNLARNRPEMLQQVININFYPGETNFALDTNNIKEWLIGHNIDLPDSIIVEILEMGYKNAIFAKRQRKNEDDEVVGLAYTLT